MTIKTNSGAYRAQLLSTTSKSLGTAALGLTVIGGLQTAEAMDLVSKPSAAAVSYSLPSQNVCRITAGVTGDQYVITGRTEPNGSTYDYAMYVGVDANLNFIASKPPGFTAPNGQTQSHTVVADLGGLSYTFPLYVGIADKELNRLINGQFVGGTAGLIELSKNDMLATGGHCADIVRYSTPGLPTADAGADQTVDMGVSNRAVLNGGNSTDPDGDPLTYTWRLVSGPSSIATPDASGSILTVRKPELAGVQVWELRVDDNNQGYDTDEVEITWVAASNVAPVVTADVDQVVYADFNGNGVTQSATVSATYSDPDGDVVSVSWRQISGPTVTEQTTPNASQTSRTFQQPSTAGTTVFEVTATDPGGLSSSDTISVEWRANQLPTTNAPADQSPNSPVMPGTTITLSAGNATDADGQPLTFTWRQTGGPSVTIQNGGAAVASFLAPTTGGVYTFEVSISDGVNTITRTVTVTLVIDQAPTADAGPNQNLVDVAPGTVVTLDGTGSFDPENAPLTYTWRQISGPTVTLQNANTATPSFTYPPTSNRTESLSAATRRGAAAENLVFGLIVSDGTQTSAEDTVQITINTNEVPVADAGADQVLIGLSNGAMVALDGSASSDPDGDALTYAWTVTSGSATLQNATSVTPNLVYTGSNTDGIDEVVEVQLIVSDGSANSAADSVSITFQDNRAPTADAGNDQSGINSGDLVILNGGGSSDPDGDSLTYSWTQVSGPTVALSDASAVSPTFTAPDVASESTLVFQLVVSDGKDQSQAATVSVSIRPVGTITIVSLATGGDTSFSFASSLPALNGSVTTSNGRATLVADRVVTGQYTVTMADARAAGFALTSLSCSDNDSGVDLNSRQATINVAPGENVTCTFSSVNSRGAAHTAIQQMQAQRGALILSNGPDIGRRIDRVSGQVTQTAGVQVAGLQLMNGRTAPFSLSMTDTEQNASVSLSGLVGAQAPTGKGSIDVWGQMTLANFDSAGKDGNFSLFYIGADYMVTDTMLVGLLAQLDNFESESSTKIGDADGQGYMVGPYITARLSDHLYADARIAIGTSDNSVSPLGSYVDDFKTDRTLFAGSLTGDFNLGETLKLRPTFEYRSLIETQKAYTDFYGVIIPESELNINELSFAPRLEKTYLTSKGDRWMTFASAEGIYNFGDEVVGVFSEDFRLRFEGGANWTSETGIQASVSAFADGIGTDNFEAQGLRLSLRYALK